MYNVITSCYYFGDKTIEIEIVSFYLWHAEILVVPELQN